MMGEQPSSMDRTDPAASVAGSLIHDPYSGLDFFRLRLVGFLFQRIGSNLQSKPRLMQRYIVVFAICWLPLLIFSMLQGLAVGDTVAVPFLRDWAVHIRFLIVIPLFLLADVITGPQLIKTIRQFETSDLIPKQDKAAFQDTAIRLTKYRGQ